MLHVLKTQTSLPWWLNNIFNIHFPNTERKKERTDHKSYRIGTFLGACAYSRKNAFWEIIENCRCAYITYIQYYRKLPVCPCSGRGTRSLIGVCAKKHGKKVCIFHTSTCGTQTSTHVHQHVWLAWIAQLDKRTKDLPSVIPFITF